MTDVARGSPAVVRLFWPQHLRRIGEPHWLLGWARVFVSQTLGEQQQLLSVVVAGAVPQSTSAGGLGQ